MSVYETYAEKPTAFLALTGYTHKEFAALLVHFATVYRAWVSTHCWSGKPRGPRRYSDYRNCPLPTLADKLFFILSYLKTNNLQTVQGALFGMSQPKANLWIHRLLPLVEQALTVASEMPARQMSAVEFDTAASLYFHDGVERAIQRPRDPENQRKFYSGKKKQHTVKNNVFSNAECKIRFLSRTVEGKKHDKKLADESEYQLPAGSRLLQDTGFQGFTVSEVRILQPQKKPRGRTLSELAKHCNHWLSSLRIRVEHTIGGVKRYRIVKDRIRNWKKGIKDTVFAICCGLHNFRLNFRPWHYPPLQLHLFVEF